MPLNAIVADWLTFQLCDESVYASCVVGLFSKHASCCPAAGLASRAEKRIGLVAVPVSASRENNLHRDGLSSRDASFIELTTNLERAIVGDVETEFSAS
jgi:hypothetical protein